MTDPYNDATKQWHAPTLSDTRPGPVVVDRINVGGGGAVEKGLSQDGCAVLPNPPEGWYVSRILEVEWRHYTPEADASYWGLVTKLEVIEGPWSGTWVWGFVPFRPQHAGRRGGPADLLQAILPQTGPAPVVFGEAAREWWSNTLPGVTLVVGVVHEFVYGPTDPNTTHREILEDPVRRLLLQRVAVDNYSPVDAVIPTSQIARSLAGLPLEEVARAEATYAARGLDFPMVTVVETESGRLNLVVLTVGEAMKMKGLAS